MTTPVARSSDLRSDRPLGVSVGGDDLVLVRTPSGPRAYQDRCPHQGAMLSEGEIDGETLVCRNHRWRFRLQDGQRVGGSERLTPCAASERDGQIFVEPVRSSTANAPQRTRRIADLPGPPGLPLIGNLHQIDVHSLHGNLERWADEYGPVYHYHFGMRPVVAVSDPALVQEVLRARPTVYRRMSKIERAFAEMGAAGVFSAEGDPWRSQRRLAMEALSHRNLRGFYDTLATIALRLKRRWERASERGDVVNVTDDLKRLTVDVTTQLAFGHDVNTIEQPEGALQQRLELLFPALQRRLFSLVPTWRFVRLPADRRLDRALDWLREFLNGLVRDARARLAEEPSRAEHPSNFLEAMLSARDDAGRPFSEEVLFGNLLTMLLAGEDTTAYTLAWAVHELCDSPQSVAALRAELDAQLGAAAVPPTVESAAALSWAGAVAKETMRLRPVAPLLYHDTNVDTVLGDLHLPADTRVALLMRVAARRQEHFAEPHAFRPPRWLTPTGTHDPSVLLPFGSGPRLCPGRSLATLELNVVLAMLYRNFEVERVGAAADVCELMAFTMQPDGLVVRLRRRS
jgi:cytochrome P450/nitrite reductase/ring-hydroxylating ferredoxin subunit